MAKQAIEQKINTHDDTISKFDDLTDDQVPGLEDIQELRDHRQSLEKLLSEMKTNMPEATNLIAATDAKIKKLGTLARESSEKYKKVNPKYAEELTELYRLEAQYKLATKEKKENPTWYKNAKEAYDDAVKKWTTMLQDIDNAAAAADDGGRTIEGAKDIFKEFKK